jgi:hypothetical protein
MARSRGQRDPGHPFFVEHEKEIGSPGSRYRAPGDDEL